jgi:hypothetical protein
MNRNRKRNSRELMTAAAAASVSQWRIAQFPCESSGRRHQLMELNSRLGLVQGTISQNPGS